MEDVCERSEVVYVKSETSNVKDCVSHFTIDEKLNRITKADKIKTFIIKSKTDEKEKSIPS